MKKLFGILFALASLCLECLPWGAVLHFANPQGEAVRKTYSYFSLVPYGYANFFPLFTAILTALLVLFSILSLFFRKEKTESTAHFLSLAAAIFSLCPLLQGIRNFSITGLGITLCLGVCVICFWKKEKTE